MVKRRGKPLSLASMIQVKATFDGEKIVLPSDFGAVRAGEVTISIPDELFDKPATGRPIWEILKDGYRSGRTVEDVTKEMREMRDEWDDDPRDHLRGRE